LADGLRGWDRVGDDGTYLQGRVQATYLDITDSGQSANACKFTFYGLGD
jgi:hypothetical protein